MSVYQHHEFLAVDRPLDDDAMDELRGISSRADISPMRFAVTYNYSDLRAEPLELLARWFDVYVYVASWGMRTFALRLPRGVMPEWYRLHAGDLDEFHWQPIDDDRELVVWSSEGEPGWAEGEGWMSHLAGVRGALIAGDQRALYLGWLGGHCLWMDDDDDDDDAEHEPPLPPGLDALDASHEALVDFLRLDPMVVAAAAEGEPDASLAPVPDDALEAAMRALPVARKDALLARVLHGEGGAVAAELRIELSGALRQQTATTSRSARTAQALMQRADALHTEAEAAERREAAAERRAHLEAIHDAREQHWARVAELVGRGNGRAYGESAQLLAELREAAVLHGEASQFDARYVTLREANRRRRSWLDRLREAGLPV